MFLLLTTEKGLLGAHQVPVAETRVHRLGAPVSEADGPLSEIPRAKRRVSEERGRANRQQKRQPLLRLQQPDEDLDTPVGHEARGDQARTQGRISDLNTNSR